ATNDDADGNDDAVPYGNNPMPLVGVDGNVVGFGGMLVTNEDDFSFFNDEFMISVWEEKIGSGVILWDEGHSQYYTKDKFSNFIEWASSYGYTVESTTSLAEELSNADAVV
ncbi:MAG: nuclease, partial [Halobacteriaceae archaeon]